MHPEALDLLYVGTLPPHRGGSAVSAAGLLRGLVGLGHRARALAPRAPEDARRGDHFAADHPALDVSRFPVSANEVDPLRPADSGYRAHQRTEIVRHLTALIRARRPDLVFIGRETFAPDVMEIADTFGLPTLIRLAGGTILGILAGNYPADLAKSIIGGCRRARVLVSPSRHLAERVRPLGLTARVILNAVDLQLFAPGSTTAPLRHTLGLEGSDLVVAHVSNLKPIKRPLDVVLAARRVLETRPGVAFVIVGDGSMRAEMEAACRQAGIHGRFRFVGWVDQCQVADYLRLADLILLPSEDEGLARVALETQACGRVLIAADNAAAREVVRPGETGFLHRTGDAEDLAAAIVAAAAAGSEARIAIGTRAREHIGRVHALDVAVATYAAAIQEAVAGPGPRP